MVAKLLAALEDDHRIEGDVTVHRTARVEGGGLLKGPVIVGPDCRIAAGSLLPGGCRLDGGCVTGPGAELKSTIMFRDSKLAHLNFVGASIIGQDVNLEAGAVIANYRNGLADPRVRLLHHGGLIEAEVLKFGPVRGGRKSYRRGCDDRVECNPGRCEGRASSRVDREAANALKGDGRSVASHHG